MERSTNENVIGLTYALLDRARVMEVLHHLGNNRDEATLQGLISLIHNPLSARATARALQILSGWDHPIVKDAILDGLHDSHVTVQFAAIRALQPKQTVELSFAIVPILKRSNNWGLRRAALEKLAEAPPPVCDEIYAAVLDPHWRVRHTLLEILRAHGTSVTEQEEILTRLLANGNDARAKGLATWLRWNWRQVPPPPSSPATTRALESWSPDLTIVAEQVLTADLNTDTLRFLLEMTDSRVQRSLKMRLRRFSKADWERVSLPDESRLPGFAILDELGLQTPMSFDERDPYLLAKKITEETAELTEASATNWATHPFAVVRAAVAKRLLNGGESPLLRALQADPHPSVRAAALDTIRAKEIIEGRASENAWEVVRRAAILNKTPLWKLETGPGWLPPQIPPAKLSEPAFKVPTKPRELGPKKLLTAPLAISGQYSLEPIGISRAMEAGVNVFFWEPGYTTLTDFTTGLARGTRQQLHFIAGTFEADPKRIRSDVERTLRNLQIEQVSFFMIFWVADWRRLSDELVTELQKLKAEGKIETCGLSTHDRGLALRAIHEGWDPIMIRHSAAHPGAENEVFPAAAAAGTSIIAFNCTCYGRLLASNTVDAADCYRYSLSKQPVRLCLCGPSNLIELEQNLKVLEQPDFPHEKLEMLLQAGRRVYVEDKIFASCVRHV